MCPCARACVCVYVGEVVQEHAVPEMIINTVVSDTFRACVRDIVFFVAASLCISLCVERWENIKLVCINQTDHKCTHARGNINIAPASG